MRGWLVGVAFVAVLVALGVWLVRDQERWEAACREQGGRVDSTTHFVSTVTGNGKPGVGTDTTYYCLTSDGRVLDVR